MSKHHYARTLADKGKCVIFVEPPNHSHSFLAYESKNATGKVTVVSGPKYPPGLRFFPTIFRVFIERIWLSKLEREIRIKISCVINFENSRFFDFRFAKGRICIYFQVDLNQNFNPETAARTADLVIGISEPIESVIKPVAKKYLRLTHGYLPASYGSSTSFDAVSHESTPKAGRATLVGNLAIQYLDVELLEALVSRFDHVTFDLIGPYSENCAAFLALSRFKNVNFLGKHPAESLPSFYAGTDVLLVTYLADSHEDQLANPHKIMEYLGSGKCVLATRTLEYDNKPELVEMANSRDEFLDKFEAIITNSAYWNSPEKMKARRDYALNNTYSKQLDRIAEALGDKGHLIS